MRDDEEEVKEIFSILQGGIDLTSSPSDAEDAKTACGRLADAVQPAEKGKSAVATPSKPTLADEARQAERRKSAVATPPRPNRLSAAARRAARNGPRHNQFVQVKVAPKPRQSTPAFMMFKSPNDYLSRIETDAWMQGPFVAERFRVPPLAAEEQPYEPTWEPEAPPGFPHTGPLCDGSNTLTLSECRARVNRDQELAERLGSTYMYAVHGLEPLDDLELLKEYMKNTWAFPFVYTYRRWTWFVEAPCQQYKYSAAYASEPWIEKYRHWMAQARFTLEDLGLPLALARLIAWYMDWNRIWNTLVQHREKHRELDQNAHIRRRYAEFCEAYYERTYSTDVRQVVSILNDVRQRRRYIMYAPATHAEVKEWLGHSGARVLQRWEAWLFNADGSPYVQQYTPAILLRRFSRRRR